MCSGPILYICNLQYICVCSILHAGTSTAKGWIIWIYNRYSANLRGNKSWLCLILLDKERACPYLVPSRTPAPPTSTISGPLLQSFLWRGWREQGTQTNGCCSGLGEEKEGGGGWRWRGNGENKIINEWRAKTFTYGHHKSLKWIQNETWYDLAMKG